MTQFNRSVSLIVGTQGAQGTAIRNMRITFKVNKNLDKDPNKAEIKIYNLNENTRNQMKENSDKVWLSAGYTEGHGEELIFVGNLDSISHSKESPNVVTTLIASDGSKELGETRANLSYGTGVSAETILRKVAKLFPLPGDFGSLPGGIKKYANGFSFIGPASSALDKISSFMELEWSIQNSELRFIPIDGNDGRRVVLLNKNSGLLGSPERLTDTLKKSKGKSKKNKPGWRVRSLLQPKILPGSQLAIESAEIERGSYFTINSVEHSGDNYGGDFVSVTEVRE